MTMLTFKQLLNELAREDVTISPMDVEEMRTRFGDKVLQMGHLNEDGSMDVPVDCIVEAYPSEEPHLDSGALLLLSSPRRGGEGGEALDGNVSNTWQDGGQVVADRNLHPAAALHDRQNRRHLRSGLLAADVDPV